MRKPIDIVADRLIEKVRRDPSGAKSLAHVLVVVPTAQSGRRLRFALAKRLGAYVPPVVRMPASFLSSAADEDRLATRADEIAAFWEAQGGGETSLDVAVQYVDIRQILAERALDFADVLQRLPDLLSNDLADVEIARWNDLAGLERRFRAVLARRGKIDRIDALKAAIASPERPDGVEEVVVACVLAPIPSACDALANLGLPIEEVLPPAADWEGARLSRWNIFPSGTAGSESAAIAEIFAAVAPEEALPALCLADAALFPEVQSALQAKGFRMHDPSGTRLATSSLGRLAVQIAALERTSSYAVFSAFVRGGDVRRWLRAELALDDAAVTAALVDLDNRQAELLPEKIDDIAPKTHGKLRAIFEFVKVQLRKKGLRDLLQVIFHDHLLDERDPSAREFVAAAECLNALIDECFAADFPEKLAWDLFARRLSEATYSLEPDSGDIVLTDGWLELPFLDADELLIAGFEEGCVPESVVGHAFLPESLRRGLGLVTNEARTARDRQILRMALACRKPGAVRVSFHSVNASGDVLKPSRLIFEVDDDAEFAARVLTCYSVRAGTGETPSADFPEAWKLRLPVPPPSAVLEKSSPSAIDEYLRCPLTYYLHRIFGKSVDYRAEELDASEFGNLAHDALELWGQGEACESEDEKVIAGELAAHVDAILGERFGTAVPAIVALQGESVKRRLAHFAAIQVEWRRAGWRVRATEHRMQVVLGHTRFSGRCDRIDFNERTGQWCVVDYKTWDAATPEKMHSFQLPLYCSMLDVDKEFPEAKRENIVSVYCVLGKTREATEYGEPVSGAVVSEVEKEILKQVSRIERGIFWPPNAGLQAWKFDFRDWMLDDSPEKSISSDWIADQLARLASDARVSTETCR